PGGRLPGEAGVAGRVFGESAIRAIYPMSSEKPSLGVDQSAQAAAAFRCGGVERDRLGGAVAMHQAGGATAGKTGGRARPGALAAMQPAAAIGHGRLAAGAADPCGGTAARRGGEVARRIAVAELLAKALRAVRGERLQRG